MLYCIKTLGFVKEKPEFYPGFIIKTSIFHIKPWRVGFEEKPGFNNLNEYPTFLPFIVSDNNTATAQISVSS